MIYFIAFLLSLAVTCLSLIYECHVNNISNLENGREPNAGAALFPLFPVHQIIALVIAFILQFFIQPYALVILVALFSLCLASQIVSVLKSKARLKELKTL